MRNTLLIILLISSGPSIAGDLLVAIGSYHTAYRETLKRDNALNEHNPGVGWQNQQYVVGGFINSEKGTSTFALRKFKLTNSVFGFAGVVTGYKAAPVLPAIGIGIQLKNTQLTFFPAQTLEGNWFAVMAYSLRFKLGK